jgi:hypothetical protein
MTSEGPSDRGLDKLSATRPTPRPGSTTTPSPAQATIRTHDLFPVTTLGEGGKGRASLDAPALTEAGSHY